MRSHFMYRAQRGKKLTFVCVSINYVPFGFKILVFLMLLHNFRAIFHCVCCYSLSLFRNNFITN